MESERAIEFDSKEEATEFMKMVLLNYPDFKMNSSHIVRTILFYDGGYIRRGSKENDVGGVKYFSRTLKTNF